VSGPLQDQQLRTGNRVTQRPAVRQRQQGVVVAVHHERRRRDVAEASPHRPVELDDEVVDQGRGVVPGARHVLFDQGLDGGLVVVR
jgi:hypothetical protein